MEQSKIDRINELARKQRDVGLSEEEAAEQAELRQAYVKSFKKNLVAQLENMYVVDEMGNKTKVTKKK